MKNKSASLITNLIVALLCNSLYAFSQNTPVPGTFAFTYSDFQIIENYIFLKTTFSTQKCPTLYYDHKPFQFHYTSNCMGWKAIRIVENTKKPVDYYLNHEISQSALIDKTHVTLVTSHGGELTNEKAIRHFLTIIDDIKLAVLVPEYFNLLFRFLLMYGKEGDVFIFQGNMISLNILGPFSKSIEITPSSENYVSYRIVQRITRRKSKIRWQYLVSKERDLVDDYFFLHYTDLLLTARKSDKVISTNTTPLVGR